MPRVPSYDSFQAAADPAPLARFDAPQTYVAPGQQAQQMGDAGLHASQGLGRIALDMQQQANQLRFDDAANQAREAMLHLTYDKDAGFTNLKGINALQRPDGTSLTDEYGDKLKKQLDQIGNTLGNDAQRQAFTQFAQKQLIDFRGEVTRHEAQEFKTYTLSTSEGIQDTAMRDIALNWNKPAAVESAAGRIQAETYRQAQLTGKSAEWQEAQARKLTSNAHKLALMTALDQGAPEYAEAYLKRYAGQMNADDMLAVHGAITKEMDNRVGLMAARNVMQASQSRIQVSEGERAFNIAVGAESGGQQFDASGQPLTSVKGAVGIAQVLPGTAPEAAKLAGLPWDEQRYRTDPTYNKALGLAYFQKQLQDNGGDLAKAYAAYNAGPAALEDAVQRADKAGGQAGLWLSYLPKETQDYVTGNMKAFAAGQGQPSRPTFANIDAQLRANPLLASNPVRYKIAREAAQQQFDEQTQAIKQRDDAAVANAMRGIMQNGGRFFDLPPAVRADVPPAKVSNLIAFAQKISKGDDATSLWLYNKLSNHPDYLKSLSDDQFFALRSELSDADFKHFSDARAKLNGTLPATNGPGDLNSQAIKQSLDMRLRMLNVDPAPKDDGGDDAARVGAIRQFVDQYFIAAQREAGRKFSDAEVSQHLDALFAKSVTLRKFALGATLFNAAFHPTYAYQGKTIAHEGVSVPLLGMKTGDIDSSTRDRIKAAFAHQGIDNPTDAQILDAFFNLKVTHP